MSVLLAGQLFAGTPTDDLALGLACAMLAITFPLLVIVVEVFPALAPCVGAKLAPFNQRLNQCF